MLGSGYAWQQISELRERKEKEHSRERKKREGKGAPERLRNKWVLGISGFVSEEKVARFDLFSGAILYFFLGLWSKLMWLFFCTDVNYLLDKKHQI